MARHSRSPRNRRVDYSSDDSYSSRSPSPKNKHRRRKRSSSTSPSDRYGRSKRSRSSSPVQRNKRSRSPEDNYRRKRQERSRSHSPGDRYKHGSNAQSERLHRDKSPGYRSRSPVYEKAKSHDRRGERSPDFHRKQIVRNQGYEWSTGRDDAHHSNGHHRKKDHYRGHDNNGLMPDFFDR